MELGVKVHNAFHEGQATNSSYLRIFTEEEKDVFRQHSGNFEMWSMEMNVDVDRETHLIQIVSPFGASSSSEDFRIQFTFAKDPSQSVYITDNLDMDSSRERVQDAIRDANVEGASYSDSDSEWDEYACKPEVRDVDVSRGNYPSCEATDATETRKCWILWLPCRDKHFGAESYAFDNRVLPHRIVHFEVIAAESSSYSSSSGGGGGVVEHSTVPLIQEASLPLRGHFRLCQGSDEPDSLIPKACTHSFPHN